MEAFALEEKLIELVRDKPFLYNKSLKEYKDTTRKENQFKEIGKTLNISGKQATEKWIQLRKQYTNYLAKLKNPSGSGTKTKPSFRHAKIMEFYKLFYRAHKTFSNISEEAEDAEEDKDRDDLGEVPGNLIEVDFNGFENEMPEVVIHETPRAARSDEMPKNRGTRKRSEPEDFNDKLLAAIEKSGPASAGDEYDFFGANIGGRTRKLAKLNFVEAANLQLEIQKLVTEAEIRVATAPKEVDEAGLIEFFK